MCCPELQHGRRGLLLIRGDAFAPCPSTPSQGSLPAASQGCTDRAAPVQQWELAASPGTEYQGTGAPQHQECLGCDMAAKHQGLLPGLGQEGSKFYTLVIASNWTPFYPLPGIISYVVGVGSQPPA